MDNYNYKSAFLWWTVTKMTINENYDIGWLQKCIISGGRHICYYSVLYIHNNNGMSPLLLP